MSIVEISTDNLVDARQIGWILYEEGEALIRVKVIRAKNNKPFLAHVTGYRQGTQVRTVEYRDILAWNQRARYYMDEFEKAVGVDYFYRFRVEKTE